MNYRLAIFDFDGTLANSFPWMVSILDSVAETFHLNPPQQEQIETLRRFDSRTILNMVGIPLWKMPLIAHHVNQRMGDEIHHIRLFEGIDRLLAGLSQQGTQLAVVSSNSAANIRQVLGPEISALIQYWECGVALYGKSTRLRNVLRQSGVQPAEAISIGDEIRDIEAAKKVAIPFGAVAWGFTHVESLIAHSPTYIFASVEELIRGLMLDTPG